MSEELNRQLDMLPERVDAGIAWLDLHYPDWAEVINPWTLDIPDGNKCILGQIAATKPVAEKVKIYADNEGMVSFSNYTKLAGMHNLGFDEPVNLGFVEPDSIHRDELATYNEALEGRWFVEIINRQAALLKRSEVAVG